MATDQKTINTRTDLEEFLGSIREIAEESRESRAHRQKSIHEVKVQTPWNPSGEARKVKLKVEHFYMCGAWCNPDMLSDAEITLINKLKSGRYNKRKWEVVKDRDRSIDIRYPRRSIDDKFEFKADAPNLETMLQKIVAEYDARIARKKAGQFEDEDED